MASQSTVCITVITQMTQSNLVPFTSEYSCINTVARQTYIQSLYYYSPVRHCLLS